MDKFKDQESSLPAATDDKKKIAVKKSGNKAQVIINPPERVDPQRGFHERFALALKKHGIILEKKTGIVLQAKAARSDFPEETLEQVYKRGLVSLPTDTQLTCEQYAMNRVNSFIAGGAAMIEDCDLLPIQERVFGYHGKKGTGGAMRPHIKREKSVYNGKVIFHVVDKQGHIKHSTNNEFEAKKHLATKYNSYNEATLSPMKRFEATKSLVKTYKDDTPGESKLKEEHKKKEPKTGFKPLMAKLTPQRGKGSFEMKVAEGRFDRRDAYERDVDSGRTGFSRPAKHRDSERHDLDAPKPPRDRQRYPRPPVDLSNLFKSVQKKEEFQIDELKDTTLKNYIDAVAAGPSRGKTQTGILKSIKAIGGVTKALRKRNVIRSKDVN